MAHADTQQHTQQLCGVMLPGIATHCAVSRHQIRAIAGPTEQVGAGGMGAHLKWLSLSTKVPLWLVRRLSTCPNSARTLRSEGQHLLMTAFRCTRRSPCTFSILVGKKVPASAAWSGRWLCEAMYTLIFIPSLFLAVCSCSQLFSMTLAGMARRALGRCYGQRQKNMLV